MSDQIETTGAEDARTLELLREMFRRLEDDGRNPFSLLPAGAGQTQAIMEFAEARQGAQDCARDFVLMDEWLTAYGWPEDPYRAPRMTCEPFGELVENLDQLRAATHGAEDASRGTTGSAANAQWGGRALLAYASACSGENAQPLDTVLADLLGDLRHLADALGEDFELADQTAAENYRAEVSERE